MTGPALPDDWPAAYVFRVTVRLAPDDPGVWAEPGTVETTVYRRADPPGEPGWRYFRDNLWRGECGDRDHMREVAEAALGARVTDVTFRELRTTQAYLDALRGELSDDLDQFNADSVDAVLSNHLGSSIHVVGDD